jgi:hypothetical protein
VRGVLGKSSSWLGVVCALIGACVAACADDEPAPGVEFDPNLVFDDGGPPPPRRPTPVGGGDRADAGKDAAAQDAAPAVSDAGVDGGGQIDAASGDASAQPEPGALESAERLLIGDGLEQLVYAYDVATRSLLESFPIGARARVYAGPGARYGYVVPSEGRDVRIIDMGFVAQGSQGRLDPVALLDARLSGATPGVLLAHSDWVALFFDGDARLEVLREQALAGDPRLPDTERLFLGAPHHGFALPFDGGFVATHVDGGGRLVLGRYDENGTLDGATDYGCAAPEGAALAAGVLAVGCVEGVLRIEPGGEASMLAYPAAAGARARRLVGHADEALHLTVLGDDRLCLVAASELNCQPAAEPWLDFGFDAGGKRALALDGDGVLRVFEADSLRALGMLRVSRTLSSSDPLLRPQLANGRRLTYVSDPQAASVHMVDPASLTLTGRLELPGTPASLAVFGFR